MGRPGLTRHRKFGRLAKALDELQIGFGEILARGALELVWDSAYENGEPHLGDAEDVEVVAHWRGSKGLLTEALLHAGFIDEIPARPGEYQVHDLFDHAPDYVQRRAEREAARVAKGKTISALRAEAGRKGAEVTNGKRAASGRQAGGHLPDNGRQLADTPAPAPAPAQEAGEPAARPGSGKTSKPSDPRLKPLELQLAAAFAEVRGGEKYPHAGARDTLALKRLLTLAGPAEITRRWRLALALPAGAFHRADSFAQLAMTEKWNHHAAPGATRRVFERLDETGAAVYRTGAAQ